MNDKPTRSAKIALALAGGGPLGAIYEHEVMDDLGDVVNPAKRTARVFG